MTAPSIKEALEIVENLIRRDPACFNLSDELLPVRSTLRALATLQPDGERREAIARLATRFWWIHPKEIQDMGLTREQFYVREMTNLLASGLVQDEAGIRASQREIDAKIADREAEFWQDAESSSARIIAANIRSARDGGAET